MFTEILKSHFKVCLDCLSNMQHVTEQMREKPSGCSKKAHFFSTSLILFKQKVHCRHQFDKHFTFFIYLLIYQSVVSSKE
jgi:hypothetical protein